MSPEEKQFLIAMDAVAKEQEEWLTRDISCRDLHSYATQRSRGLEEGLKAAGRIIGLLPRFQVTLVVEPRDVISKPLNGAGERLLARYRELYIERELSDGFSKDILDES